MRQERHDQDDAPVAVLFTQLVGVVLTACCFPVILISLFTFMQDDRLLLTGYAMMAASWMIRIVLPFRSQK